MIVLIGSQKGGVGKSTKAVNIAGYLILKQGKTAIIVDADDQKSIMTWYNDRQNVEGLPHIPVVAASGKIKETLLELDRHYDYVIVDTAGRDSAELRSGCWPPICSSRRCALRRWISTPSAICRRCSPPRRSTTKRSKATSC